MVGEDGVFQGQPKRFEVLKYAWWWWCARAGVQRVRSIRRDRTSERALERAAPSVVRAEMGGGHFYEPLLVLTCWPSLSSAFHFSPTILAMSPMVGFGVPAP
jgi:hypothetical protein